MRKLTLEQFVEKANLFHNNKFDYSKFVYVRAKIPSIIICPLHGEFLQSPDKHTKKKARGCLKCYLEFGKKRDHMKIFNSNLSSITKAGCIEWLGHINTGNYGDISVNKKRILAHRFSWELIHGKIPKGLFCLHKCDNRKCVNVEHLFLGTIQDNCIDMFKKGRGNRAEGEKNYRSILKDSQAIEIRKLHLEGIKRRFIAKIFNVSPSMITKIISRITYKHI